MKWIHKDNGDWEAVGEYGDFLIWKEGSVWKGRYRSTDHKKYFFLPPQKKFSDMKTLCQDNANWERPKPQELSAKESIRACLNCKVPVSQCKGTCTRRRRVS